MAKYAENVNQQTKIIDVQKQFPGGLKTVDTDDALGKVYLRKADNVSLSEYSFLEKRHGTSIEHVVTFEPGDEPSLIQPIQGYFEYKKEDGSIDKLLFIGGTAYIKQSTDSDYKKVTAFNTEEGFIYPDSDIYSEVTGSVLLDLNIDITDIALATLEATFAAPGQIFETFTDTAIAALTANIQADQEEELTLSDTTNASLSALIKGFSVEQPGITNTVNIGITVTHSTGLVELSTTVGDTAIVSSITATIQET